MDCDDDTVTILPVHRIEDCSNQFMGPNVIQNLLGAIHCHSAPPNLLDDGTIENLQGWDPVDIGRYWDFVQKTPIKRTFVVSGVPVNHTTYKNALLLLMHLYTLEQERGNMEPITIHFVDPAFALPAGFSKGFIYRRLANEKCALNTDHIEELFQQHAEAWQSVQL